MAINSLKNLREELGLTQATFAGILGMKRAYLAAVESGRLNLPEAMAPIVHWIEENRDRFKVTEQKPESDNAPILKDLKQLRLEKQKRELDLEKRLEKEKSLLQTQILCEGLLQQYPNPTQQMKLYLDSVAYDAGLDLERLQSSPSLRMSAKILAIEAEIQALEKGIAKEG